MTFGVYQFIKYRHLLGSAGAEPNDMPDEKRSNLVKWTKLSLVLMFIVIGMGLLGLISVEPIFFLLVIASRLVGYYEQATVGLIDPAIIWQVIALRDNLTQIFNTGSIYSFQK